MDWSNSLWGFILGLLILLLNIASLVIFFSISSKDHNVDEYVGKVIHSVTNCYGIGALLYGLICIQRLVEKSDPEPALMDLFLLKLSAMFVIVYTCFTITVGIFPTEQVEDIPGGLHIVDGIFNLVETVLQVVFIELLLTKTIRLKPSLTKLFCNSLIRKGETGHPGRQAVSLLILMNLALWLVDTFELQVSSPSLTQLGPFCRNLAPP